MKKQVITFGQAKIAVGLENGKDIIILSAKKKGQIGQYIDISKDVHLNKSLVLRFESLESLNVLQDLLDDVRYNLNLKKSLGGKK